MSLDVNPQDDLHFDIQKPFNLTDAETQKVQKYMSHYVSAKRSKQAYFTIINAVKSLFGKSDWQKAQKILNAHSAEVFVTQGDGHKKVKTLSKVALKLLKKEFSGVDQKLQVNPNSIFNEKMKEFQVSRVDELAQQVKEIPSINAELGVLRQFLEASPIKDNIDKIKNFLMNDSYEASISDKVCRYTEIKNLLAFTKDQLFKLKEQSIIGDEVIRNVTPAEKAQYERIIGSINEFEKEISKYEEIVNALSNNYLSNIEIYSNEIVGRLGVPPELKETIKKVINISFQPNRLVDSHLVIERHPQIFGTSLVVVRDKENPLKLRNIVDFTTMKILGRGSFGTVFMVFDYVSREFLAFKFAQAIGNVEESVKSVKNEYTVLTEIHKDGIIEGIQLPPHLFISRHHNIGYLTVRYDDSILNMIDKKAIAQIDFKTNFKRLINALGHLVQKNIYHSDIDPSNILVKNGKCDLADFGIVHALGDLEQGLTRDMMKEGYGVQRDQVLINQARDEKNPEKLKKIQTARMILALGITLKKWWEGGRYGFFETYLKGVKDTVDYSPQDKKAIKSLISQMTKQDAKKRIDIAQLVKTVNETFR